MKGLPEERAIRLAQYIVEEGATVRQAAKKFGVSKSTVHKDITTRLKQLNGVLYTQVQAVLGRNKRERHIRGGLATKEKYRAAQMHARHKTYRQRRLWRQSGQIYLPWNCTRCPVLPQKAQVVECFFRMMWSPSTWISTGSWTLMSKARRISAGRTMRPRSSILRTMPVDF